METLRSKENPKRKMDVKTEKKKGKVSRSPDDPDHGPDDPANPPEDPRSPDDSDQHPDHPDSACVDDVGPRPMYPFRPQLLYILLLHLFLGVALV